MRSNIQLQIDGYNAEIDNDTAIGITIRGLDFDNPESLGLNYSSRFTIPSTVQNDKILGFADNVNQYTLNQGGKPYAYHGASIYIDGILAMKGKLYVDGYSSGRYSVAIVDSRDLYDELESLDFINDDTCVTSIIADSVNQILDTSSIDDFDDLIGFCATGTNEIWMPYAAGTLFHQFPYEKVDDDNVSTIADKYPEDGTCLEDYNKFVTEYITGSSVVGNYKTGHFYVNVKFMIETIYESMGVLIELPSDIPSDYLCLPDMIVYYDSVNQKYRFAANTTYRRNVGDNEPEPTDRNFLSFVKMYIAEYCMVVDSYFDTQSRKYKYEYNFFSGIAGSNKIKLNQISKPDSVSYKMDIPQESWITYSTLGNENDSSSVGGRLITSINVSADKGGSDTSLFTIDRYLAAYMTYVDNDNVTETKLLATNDPEISKQFVMVRRGSISPYTVTVSRYNSVSNPVSVSVNLYTAVQATVGTEDYWDVYADIVYSPVRIGVEVAMDPSIMSGIKQFGTVSFSGLSGVWYVTEIGSYNPRTDAKVKIQAVLLR